MRAAPLSWTHDIGLLGAHRSVSKDEPIVDEIGLAPPRLRVVRLRRILDQHTRLQPRPVLPAYPGEFETGLSSAHDAISVRARSNA
jgi:hypothetical protein